MTFKQFVYKTPFAKLAKDIQAEFHYQSIVNQSGQWSGKKTVYCLSPYKTGTTFLASSFDKTLSQHEPCQYLSLQLFEKDFDKFFVKRLNKLDLKLECSPYFSAYIDQLASNEVSKELTYLCILREPSAWISSVVNFYNRPYTQTMQFEYENELFWKRTVGVDVRNIITTPGQIKEEMRNRIIDFYFNFTESTQKLDHIHYVKLHDLKSSLDSIGELIGEKPDLSKSWMRKTKPEEKIFIYKDEELDKKYNQLISSFTTLKH